MTKRIIQDLLPGLPLLIALKADTASFHVWNRNVNGGLLRFRRQSDPQLLTDENTGMAWNIAGNCVFGVMKGAQLQPVQASQEFWHSWQIFHPNTKK